MSPEEATFRLTDYLEHLIEAAQLAQSYIDGLTKPDFTSAQWDDLRTRDPSHTMNHTSESLHQGNDPHEEYHELVAVAALDILGMKNLITRSDSGKMAMKATRKFVRNACSSGYYSAESLDTKVGDFYRTGTYFGDSVYLFATPSASITQQIALLSAKVSSLIAMGLWGDVRFLVRAAIATGDLRTATIATDCGQHEIRVGTAMVRAHMLESAQPWIGAALEIDDPAHLSEAAENWTFDYPVPLKDSATITGRLEVSSDSGRRFAIELRGATSQQVTGEACIAEVQLGCVDEPLGAIAEPGWQVFDQKQALYWRQICSDSWTAELEGTGQFT